MTQEMVGRAKAGSDGETNGQIWVGQGVRSVLYGMSKDPGQNIDSQIIIETFCNT